LPSSATDR